MDYKTEQIKNKLSELESQINDSNDVTLEKEFYELKNLISSKLDNVKYGLVFEETKEDIEVKCETMIPYLEREREINASAKNGKNFLIEGDNYASLKLLEKTHKGKIDIVYIDPPYNLGNNDFSYNDKYVNSDDEFRHSKRLSFMEKRLTVAKNLLSEKGLIFISIDETELANLTLLCNEIFGERNYVSSSFVLDNLKGKTNDNFVTSVGSRLLIFAKNRNISSLIGFNEVENIFGKKVEETYSLSDELGFYNLITFKKTGQSKYREDRPFMFYPILEKNGMLYSISDDEFENLYSKDIKKFNDDFLYKLKKKYSQYNFILPLDKDGAYLRWTSSFNTFKKKINTEIVFDNGSVKQKNRPTAQEFLQDFVSGTPKSLMYKSLYANGTNEFKDIFKKEIFSFPKPVELIKDIMRLIKDNEYIILDFFAGSGTTGQAVLELNKEDGGKRHFILCTNNENNICEDVTYERLKTVITGKRKDGSIYRENPYEDNLTYLKVNFAEKDDDIDFYKICEQLIALKSSVENRTSFIFDNDDKFYDFLKSSVRLDDCVVYLLDDILLPSGSNLKERKIEIRELPKYFYSEEELINNDTI